MASRDPSEFDRWADAFDRAWKDPSNIGSIECPTCGNHALSLVYVFDDDLESDRGMYAFWCGVCLTGFPPGYGPVPEGAVRVRRGEEQVPNYRLVIDNG